MNEELERLRRKRDQAWDLAGLARQDGCAVDELRWTQEARRLQREIREHILEKDRNDT